MVRAASSRAWWAGSSPRRGLRETPLSPHLTEGIAVVRFLMEATQKNNPKSKEKGASWAVTRCLVCPGSLRYVLLGLGSGDGQAAEGSKVM